MSTDRKQLHVWVPSQALSHLDRMVATDRAKGLPSTRTSVVLELILGTRRAPRRTLKGGAR